MSGLDDKRTLKQDGIHCFLLEHSKIGGRPVHIEILEDNKWGGKERKGTSRSRSISATFKKRIHNFTTFSVRKLLHYIFMMPTEHELTNR